VEAGRTGAGTSFRGKGGRDLFGPWLRSLRECRRWREWKSRLGEGGEMMAHLVVRNSWGGEVEEGQNAT
jgi:hypothetical protein